MKVNMNVSDSHDSASAGAGAGAVEAIAALRDIIAGLSRFEAVHAVAELDIADVLGPQAKTAAELAAQASLAAGPLERVLRYLAATGVVRRLPPAAGTAKPAAPDTEATAGTQATADTEAAAPVAAMAGTEMAGTEMAGVEATVGVEEGDRYALTPMGHLLRRTHPRSQRAMILMRGHDLWREGLRGLAQTLELGLSPLVLEHGGLYPALKDRPPQQQVFDEAMQAGIGPIADALAGHPDLPAVRTVVDIGGGRGTVLRAILRAHPHITGVIVDQPPAVADARTLLAAENLEDRAQAQAADIFTDPLPAHADVYLLCRVIHNHAPQRIDELLQGVLHVMPNHGQLWVVETPLPQDDRPHPALDLDMMMLVLGAGAERTGPQYEHLLERAGFRLHRTQSLPLEAELMVFTRGRIARPFRNRRTPDDTPEPSPTDTAEPVTG